MDAPYVAIAHAINEHCPNGYRKATLIARLAEGFSEQEIWCETEDSRMQPDLPSMEGWKISQALHEIRKSMTIPGQQPWSRCTFTLFPDGKFKFDVEYDD